MNVREIVAAYLRSNQFDGLACDGCGCGVNDLMPCDMDGLRCEPAKRVPCDGTCSGCETPLTHKAEHCYRVSK